MAMRIPIGSGAAALGAALGGGGSLRQQAFNQRQRQLAQMFVDAARGHNLQADTALKRHRYDAQTGLGDAFAQAYGVSPEVGSALATIAISASTSNPEQIAGIGMRREAADETNPVVANRILSALDGKPNDLTKVSGNVAFDPTVPPNAQDIAATPVGEALIGLKAAQSASEHAQAAKFNASAQLDDAKRTNPEKFNASRSSSAGINPIGVPSRKDVIAQLYGKLGEAGAASKFASGIDGNAGPSPDQQQRERDITAVQQWFAQQTPEHQNWAWYRTHGTVGLPGVLPPAGTAPLSPALQAPTATHAKLTLAEAQAAGMPVRRNPSTGAMVAFDGQRWVPVGDGNG